MNYQGISKEKEEELRIENLYSYDILDTDEEPEFNDLIKLACHICQCETAMISFVDTNRQWFKASINAPTRESDRESSFCTHTILDENLTIINDATQDSRFRNNPNVTGGMEIAFYAGAPIKSAAGYALGTVCVIDKVRKEGLTPIQESALTIIANQVSQLLELKLQNKQILAYTAKVVNKEKKITGANIDTQEDANTYIATELSENFAQTLAASKMYIELALQEKNMSSSLLEKSKNGLTNVIRQLKNLSKSITPTTFEHADYNILIQHLCEDFALQNNITVTCLPHKEFLQIKEKTGLLLYRIIEEQLKIAKDSKATTIIVHLIEGKVLTLIFKHNGRLDESNFNFDVSLSNINARTQLLNAKPTYINKEGDFHVYQINIPLR
jgi:signal transduction histidine kinase